MTESKCPEDFRIRFKETSILSSLSIVSSKFKQFILQLNYIENSNLPFSQEKIKGCWDKVNSAIEDLRKILPSRSLVNKKYSKSNDFNLETPTQETISSLSVLTEIEEIFSLQSKINGIFTQGGKLNLSDLKKVWIILIKYSIIYQKRTLVFYLT